MKRYKMSFIKIWVCNQRKLIIYSDLKAGWNVSFCIEDVCSNQNSEGPNDGGYFSS